MKYLILFFALSQTTNGLAEFKTLEEVYDFWAHDYHALMVKTNYKIADWFKDKRHLLPDQDCLVLDLGCADGSTGEILSQYYPHYTFFGVDFSQRMVEKCLQKNLYSQVLHADLNNGLPDEVYQRKYDIIIATGCLEFIYNHENLFYYIKQCLNSDGLFWLTLATKERDSTQTFLNTKIMYYMQQEACTILERCGFIVIDLEINPCAYIDSTTKESIPYFMIIAKKLNM